jgi:hypothetical protein
VRRRRLRQTLAAALVFGLASGAGAESEPYSQETLGLYQLSGLASRIGSLEFQIVESISIQTQRLPEVTRRTLIDSVSEQFDSGAVRAAALEGMEGIRKPEHAKALLEWLRSPIGRRITELDVALSTPEGMAALQAYARTLADGPPLPERVAFAERLDAATGATNIATDAAVGSNLVIAAVINATRPVSDRLRFGDLLIVIEAQREQLRALVQEPTLVTFLYMHSVLPEGDLERYAEFFESDAGVWHQALASKALIASLYTLAARVDGVLGEALKTGGTRPPL